MKTLSCAFLVAVLCMPRCSLAQQSTPLSNDIQIELAQENEFVVKMMDVVNKSGKIIPELVELDSFSIAEKLFIFIDAKGKHQKISAKEINKIVFIRLRQGILTGKPPSLRLNVWNGKIKKIELNYRDVKILNGHLFIGQNEVLKHFDGSDTLSANSYEWSEKLHQFWNRKEAKSPEVYSTDFAFNDGYGAISRNMAAAYCRSCLKIEILNLKIDPEKETILIHCKDVFYDKYI